MIAKNTPIGRYYYIRYPYCYWTIGRYNPTIAPIPAKNSTLEDTFTYIIPSVNTYWKDTDADIYWHHIFCRIITIMSLSVISVQQYSSDFSLLDKQNIIDSFSF